MTGRAAAVPSGTGPASTFSVASAVRALGDGTFTADLSADWTVGSRPHGGFLLALMGRAGVQAVAAAGGAEGTDGVDPLVVSAQFLRPPEVGPVLLRAELRKLGRTASVVAVNIEQRGRSCVESTVTVGHLADDPPTWTDLPDMPAGPPLDAVDLGGLPSANAPRLVRGCDVRVDQATAGFLHGKVGDPLRLRLWVRPRGEQPDALFALLSGDVSMPVTFNLGRYGWSPTVQVTALLRGRPAPGWLRVDVTSRAVHGQWFDQDATVIDAAGRLVGQCRQLALTPRER
ncbi:MAG TPA: thioesterase family protein [Pseudonocardiaceae bacterium]|nr:thioesterase family protein [Pseudonocardiaceae bacterium]